MLIVNGLVLTLDRDRRVMGDGAVAVEGDRIVAVGRTGDLVGEYGSDEVVDASGRIVMPGLVNAHCHMFAMFSRGLGADGGRSRRRGESEYSWDIVRLQQFDGEACYTSGMLAAAELLRSGVTTTQDSHYINFHRDAVDGVARSVAESGMRAVLGRGCWDAPGLAPEEVTEDVEGAMRESERVISRWHGGADGRIAVRVEASMLAQCTDEMIRATKELATRHGLGWASHIQYRLGARKGDPRGDDASLRRYNGRSVEYLESLDVLGPDSLLVHCTHVDSREIAILARTKTPVAHCPVASAWTGSPVIADVPGMLKKGVTVGLGTDSVATNDSLDLFQAMKFCALIHKVNMGDTGAMTAEKVIEMATIDSARALNMEHDVGSLEPGKKADIILVDMESPGYAPSINPVKNIVYGAGGGCAVETVIIDGETVMEDGVIRTFDEPEAYARAEEKGREILMNVGRLEPGERYLKDSPWKML